MRKPFLIAEIGINHNGDIEIAKKMIAMAKRCGWDAVKFQKRNLELCIPKEMRNKNKSTPWGDMTYYEYKKHIEFSKDEYDEIDKFCKHMNIQWFASAWDIDSQIFIDKYNLNYNKIASAMLTHNELLRHVAKKGKTTFISTGMSTWDSIDNAINIFEEENCPYILMHCVGLYPCPNDKLNISMINTLKNKYNCSIGYSGHSPGAIDAIVATVLGANYIEKHITLDRTMWGSDHSASIEEHGMEYIRKHSDNIDSMLGSGRRYLSNKEIEVSNKLRYWK
jgi:N-acetylneuraminate synthase